MDPTLEAAAAQAADAIRDAEVLLVGAGAGMGVDSGLPDFRGDHGFWKAYPPYERLGITFVEAANPERFESDPALGWGFYGHRLGLYRATVPHAGFGLLRNWIDARRLPSFVYTSNVDGQFQKAGFDEDRLVEVHGSIHHLQCAAPCSGDIWPNDERVDVDEATMRANRVVSCPRCGGVARPNILMFGDWSWLPDRTHAQATRFEAFLAEHRDRRLVAIELGAGTAVPSVRLRSEQLARLPGATLVRVNPREPQAPSGAISLAAGALAAIEAIDRALGR
jgi:NAD-dependent SIR2 family protein deacetylase